MGSTMAGMLLRAAPGCPSVPMRWLASGCIKVCFPTTVWMSPRCCAARSGSRPHGAIRAGRNVGIKVILATKKAAGDVTP
jgi:hypothetical protein